MLHESKLYTKLYDEDSNSDKNSQKDKMVQCNLCGKMCKIAVGAYVF